MSKRVRTKTKLIGDTPLKAAVPLIPFLKPGVRFWEPCAGKGNLIWALNGHAECVCATDVAPRAEGIFRANCLDATAADVDATGAEIIITNTPWPDGTTTGAPAVPILDHLSQLRPTWALLSWDFFANVYASRLPLARIVPIGRVSWQGNGKNGFENAGWGLFDARHIGAPRFTPRATRGKGVSRAT